MGKKKELKREIKQIKQEIESLSQALSEIATQVKLLAESGAVTKNSTPKRQASNTPKKSGSEKGLSQQEDAPATAPTEKPVASDDVKEDKPATRTRRTRKPVDQTKKASKKEKPLRTKAKYVFYNCDENKSEESKFNSGDETFSDTMLGRRNLWKKIKGEIDAGKVIIEGLSERNVHNIVLHAKPESVNPNLKYGLIEVQ